jgi:hypothetical protein
MSRHVATNPALTAHAYCLWEPVLQRGEPFFYCALTFLHFMPIASNPSPIHTIGILSFVSTARVCYAAL